MVTPAVVVGAPCGAYFFGRATYVLTTTMIAKTIAIRTAATGQFTCSPLPVILAESDYL